MTPAALLSQKAEADGPRPVRPRDAAAVILLDRQRTGLRVLLGRRSSAHVFMPDTYVFPGGRRDPRDHALPYETDLHPLVLARLTSERQRGTTASARALALAAVRELEEETGLLIGDKLSRDGTEVSRAHLQSLRYVARAITPPGFSRRYDTRFFCTFVDEAGVDLSCVRDSAELLDLRWVDIGESIADIAIPNITRIIIDHIRSRVMRDSRLAFEGETPFYSYRHGRPVQSYL